MRRKIIAINAITSKIWIRLPAENTKKPSNQPIKRIIAIR
jgi:hypothetical protein